MFFKVPDIQKRSLIERVVPNFIYNRFDLMYGNDFDLYELAVDDRKIYVPVHIRKKRAEVGLWFVPLQGIDMDAFFSGVFCQYRNINSIGFSHCLVPVGGISSGAHWHIDLQTGVDKFNAALSGRTRYNMRWYEKKMRSSFEYDVQTYGGVESIPQEVVEKYLSLKNKTHRFEHMPWREYLQRFHVTDAWVLRLDHEIAAVLFLSIVDKNVYLENLSHEEKFQKYSTGTVLLYTVICHLMNKSYAALFLGGGNLEYKKRFNGVETMTYSGVIYNEHRMSFLRRVKRKFLEGVGVLLGLKRQ